MDSFAQNVFTIIGFGEALFFVETGVCIRGKVGAMGMKEYIVQAFAQETIDSFDAHNAPELIRCMDCKNLGYTNSHWFCKWLNRCVDEDWFCADGKRKEDR